MAGPVASAWPVADLSAVGICGEGADLSSLSAVELAHGLAACRCGQAFLDWQQFRYAQAVFDREVAAHDEGELSVIAHSVLDVYARVSLQLQFGLDSTGYAADQLLDDALAARDRLPRCAEHVRTGRIDRRRFHALCQETALVEDPGLLARIDAAIAAEIAGLGGATSLSVTKTAHLARRHVAQHDPDGARRLRDNARKGRGVSVDALEFGMARLSVVDTAENIALTRRTIEAIVDGRCPNDPRSKGEARADAVASFGGGPAFACLCGGDGCTARISPTEVDERVRRIVIHVLTLAGTLDDLQADTQTAPPCPGPTVPPDDGDGVTDGSGPSGGPDTLDHDTGPDTDAEIAARYGADNVDGDASADRSAAPAAIAGRDMCGYLDGHGPISAEHVRDLARRDDARIVRHDLDALLDHRTPPPRNDDTANTVDDLRSPVPVPPAEPGSSATTRDDATGKSTSDTGSRLRSTTENSPASENSPTTENSPASGNGSSPTVPDDPGNAFDWEPPVEWFLAHDPDSAESDDFDPEYDDPPDDPAMFPTDPAGLDALLDRLIARDPDCEHYPLLLDRAVALLDAPTTTPAPTPVIDGPGLPDAGGPGLQTPIGVIARTSLDGDPYRPTALLDLVVRFLWGTCTVPGCDRPASACDLDHIEEFDQLFPQRGGPTCLCNLAPKCRYHHLIKTSLDGYLDDLWLDTEGRYRISTTVPGGYTLDTLAPNHWLLPQLDRLRCTHQLAGDTAAATTSAPAAAADPAPARRRTRTQAKHDRRRAERARHRRERETELARQEEIAATCEAIARATALARRLHDNVLASTDELLNPPPF